MAEDWHPGKAFVDAVLTELVPKVESSTHFIALSPKEGSDGDVKFWVELGLAVMLDKPIVAVVWISEDERYKLPRKLRIVANEIVFAPDGMNEQVARAVQEAVIRIGHGNRTA
jgi:hypothetical protein